MRVVSVEEFPPLVESLTKSIRQRQPFSVSHFVRQDAMPLHLRTPQEFFDAVGARVLPTTGKPRYCPLPRHEILMPPVEWLGEETYWSCLAHELVHYVSALTGVPWKDEVLAEVGGSIVEVLLGLPPCADHTNINKFFGRWNVELDADPMLVSSIAALAIESVDRLIERASYVQTPEDKQTEAALVTLAEKSKREFAG